MNSGGSVDRQLLALHDFDKSKPKRYFVDGNLSCSSFANKCHVKVNRSYIIKKNSIYAIRMHKVDSTFSVAVFS